MQRSTNQRDDDACARKETLDTALTASQCCWDVDKRVARRCDARNTRRVAYKRPASVGHLLPHLRNEAHVRRGARQCTRATSGDRTSAMMRLRK